MQRVTRPFVLMICLVLLVISCSKPQDRLLGEWKGTDQSGQPGSLVFNPDGTAKLTVGGLALDGRPLPDPATPGKTVMIKTTWRLDAHQTPMQLDFVLSISKGSDTTERVIPMIIRFVSDNKIQIRMNDDMQSRPMTFSDTDEKNQMVLTKQ